MSKGPCFFGLVGPNIPSVGISSAAEYALDRNHLQLQDHILKSSSHFTNICLWCKKQYHPDLLYKFMHHFHLQDPRELKIYFYTFCKYFRKIQSIFLHRIFLKPIRLKELFQIQLHLSNYFVKIFIC